MVGAAPALRVFQAETRLTVYRSYYIIRMQDELAVDWARAFSQILTSFRSYKSMFFLWSKVVIQFIATTFDELSYFSFNDNRYSFKTAAEVASRLTLHDSKIYEISRFWNISLYI